MSEYNYVPRLIGSLKQAFPHFSPNKIEYLANKVTNHLRKLKCDMYTVEISAQPFQPESGRYHTHVNLTVDSVVIHMRITVD